MNRWIVVLGLLLVASPLALASARAFETDVINTSAGDLTITFVGHGSLMFGFGGKTIHVDPDGRLTDYAKLPKADCIVITHEHGDHLDPAAIALLRKDGTVIVASEAAAAQLAGDKVTVMANGDGKTVLDIPMRAVPAYNLVHMRSEGVPYHPMGRGNGMVMTFGDKRVYVAGDTENIPEMKALEGVDVAFLPMNLPYTMTPEMVAAAARMMHPKILYPYHTGDTDVSKLAPLLTGLEGTELRIRQMR